MSLLTDVAGRLADLDLDVGTQALALAACVGEPDLDATLAGQAPVEPEPEAAGPAAPPVRLASVTVEGFRGIGPSTTLDLEPANGLTLVVGHNGSGKSSFAEAVEFALTGDNRRWSKRSRVWRDGWRNLHHEGPARVEAAFVAEDGTTAVVGRAWAADAGLPDHEVGPDDPASLGWEASLELYRPFLPYSELGALVDDGPTALHDALSSVLGLDVLTAGAKRLRDARLERERAWKSVVADAQDLADRVEQVDDPRAAEVMDALRTKAPDPDAIAGHAAAGDPSADPAMDTLRVLVGLPGPDLDAVRRAADAVHDAVDQVGAAASSDAARDVEVADLLAAARRLHVHAGDADCPVCGEGRLDEAWRTRAEEVEQRLRHGATEVQRANDVLVAARRVLAAVATDPPVVLRRAGVAGIDASLAEAAWQDLAAARDIEDDRERAVAVRRAAEATSNALTDLRARAKAALADRVDEWAPTARLLAPWVERARVARREAGRAADLKKAEKALNDVLDQVRAERWRPIAAQAQGVWERLGQGSSVTVEDVALAGSGTRRRVEVAVTVDGISGAALGVMSQGELHALALSLFLPRAGLDESPFRFLVIDDPVQSMDSIRVDGLARVLDDAAKHRQVVVFTHDERLREAVHRQGIAARVVEVARGPNSRVELRHSLA